MSASRGGEAHAGKVSADLNFNKTEQVEFADDASSSEGTPWAVGSAQVQLLALTPREYFAAGIKAANVWTRKTYGRDFDLLAPAEREAALEAIEAGKADFADFNARGFFEALYQSAMEGFFADPIYGGNRNKVSWRMVGYPGLPATYAAKALEYRGKKVVIEPQSIADFS
jgi:gluconate 2-dehydrogenase gamma chain